MSPLTVAIANVIVATFMAEHPLSALAPPPEGVEVNTYALTTNVYRANNTLESFSYEGIKLYGCERDGIERERSWFERLLDATPDALSDVWGVAPASVKDHYLPDAIRMEVTGVRFTGTLKYHVTQLGIPAGSGDLRYEAGGTIVYDDISIRMSDIEADRGAAGRPVRCGGTVQMMSLNYTGPYHGSEWMYMGNSPLRPDMMGFICDGHETENHNPLSTGWHWVGPGPPPTGLLAKSRESLQEKCALATPVERLLGFCVFPWAWPQAMVRLAEMRPGAATAVLGFYCVLPAAFWLGVIWCCCRRSRPATARAATHHSRTMRPSESYEPGARDSSKAPPPFVRIPSEAPVGVTVVWFVGALVSKWRRGSSRAVSRNPSQQSVTRQSATRRPLLREMSDEVGVASSRPAGPTCGPALTALVAEQEREPAQQLLRGCGHARQRASQKPSAVTIDIDRDSASEMQV